VAGARSTKTLGVQSAAKLLKRDSAIFFSFSKEQIGNPAGQKDLLQAEWQPQQ
jgi:hypothetical protein